MKSLILILISIIFISCGKKGDSITQILPADSSTKDTVALTPECSCENIIKNGSFEEGHNLGNNKWGVFDELDGWHALIDDVDAPIEIQNGQNIGGLAPSDGSAKLEMDSHNRNGYTQSDAIVYQDIETSADALYELSFDYAPRVRRNATTNIVEVYWDGELVGVLNGIDNKWTSFKLRVYSISNFTRLSFKAIQDSDTLGGYIDNVKLERICNTTVE